MTPQVHTLANGVRVVCDPMPGLQTVALSVVAGRGARHIFAAPERTARIPADVEAAKDVIRSFARA